MDTAVRYKLLKVKNKLYKFETSRRGMGNIQGSDKFKEDVDGDRQALSGIPVSVWDARQDETEGPREVRKLRCL